MAGFVDPAIQAMNLIREIGDKVSRSGKPIERYNAGSEFSVQLINELEKDNIIKTENVLNVATGARNLTATDRGKIFVRVNLTLKGWKRYKKEKRGEFAGNYGFIAMQFNDSELDFFIDKIVKPTVKEETGYDLVDMRDVAQAGVIDNIMRVQIRDAAFVIADLTHDNHGAYWEAGYAEGLGKPVVYICEKTKFEKEKSHFDTNHCTTVPWSRDESEKFSQELIATLRRSLDRSP